MSLVKILILSNVLDPTVSLQELIEAFWAVDKIENDEIEESRPDRADARDTFIRSLTILL